MPEDVQKVETTEETTDDVVTETTETTETVDGEQFDADRAMSTIRKQRELERQQGKEITALQRKLKKLEDVDKKRKESEMSELEKAQSDLDSLNTQYGELGAEYDSLKLRQAFYDAVGTEELVFATDQARRDAYALADLASAIDGGKIDDKAIKKELKALQDSRPYLFGKVDIPATDATKRNQGDKGQPTDEDVKEFAARLGVDPQFVDRSLLVN